MGSPWAIGGKEGGHDAIHPELGSVADFERLVKEAAALGIEIALDYALDHQDRLMPLHEAIFLEPGVAGAKYALSLLGRCSEEVRSPLLPPTDRVKDAIRAAMVHAGLLN